MLECFLVFDTKGVVLHEEGTRPCFANSYIEHICLDSFRRRDRVQDLFVFYEVRGPLVYLAFSRKNSEDCLADAINRYESKENAGGMQAQSEKQKEEERDALDYSTSAVFSQEVADVKVSKVIPIRGFRVFSNKIHIGDIYDKVKTHLISKNVEPEVAAMFCDAIRPEFHNEWIGESEFREKMRAILGRFVKGVDHGALLAQIREKRTRGRVFSMCFVGVNGVGKSTSLAKVCCWLLQHGLRVYIAACDTFRAGAVEQLRVHVQRFRAAKHNVGFYEKGYNKDDAVVCRNAMGTAKNEGYDVVLVDTAGRMHNKRHLMQSLTKLIRYNMPDHIVFVGEALVGGDSLEHLREFNKAVGEGTERRVDSILLTKVDTVDDKIGQIVNMAVSADAPILFLGTGQSNVDLTEIDANTMASIIMS